MRKFHNLNWYFLTTEKDLKLAIFTKNTKFPFCICRQNQKNNDNLFCNEMLISEANSLDFVGCEKFHAVDMPFQSKPVLEFELDLSSTITSRVSRDVQGESGLLGAADAPNQSLSTIAINTTAPTKVTDKPTK